MKRTSIFLFLCILALSGLGTLAVPAAGEEPGAERIAKSVEVLQQMVDVPKTGLPSRILEKCHGIAVIPGVIKAAYGVGGQYGRGLVVIRNDDGTWSNPAFISLIGGSLGWQIGVQKADIVLVFKTLRSIDDIAKGKVTLGADASIAAGPVGRTAEASTDLEMEAEIYSYSRSKGLFAGIAIKGASIQIDKDADEAFYGQAGLDAHAILYDRMLKAPAAVEDLKRVLMRKTEPKI